MIKDLPSNEKPRERLYSLGADALATTELLAIIMGSGTKGKSVLDLSQELFAKFGSLERLIDASIPELKQVKGIGEAKAIQLHAAFALAKRSLQLVRGERPLVNNPKVASQLIMQDLASKKEEHMVVLLRDARGRLQSIEKVAIGTINQVTTDPREILYHVIRNKAHSFIIAHNHPSGDPMPSKADYEVTRTLIASSNVMGIPLVDHIVVGNNNYISFIENGLLQPFVNYSN